jgi:hypothetical protein
MKAVHEARGNGSSGGHTSQTSTAATSATAALGQELLRLRLLRGLSLRKLARLLGMAAHSGLVDYEKGSRIPPKDLMCSYQQVLRPDNGHLRELYRAALADRVQQRMAAARAAAARGTHHDEAGVELASGRDQHCLNAVTLTEVAAALEKLARQLRQTGGLSTATAEQPGVSTFLSA